MRAPARPGGDSIVSAMPRLHALILLLLGSCLGVNAVAQTGTRLHHYRVEVDSQLTVLNVRACFAGALPRYLMAESLDAAGALRNAQVEGARRALEPNGAQLPLKSDLHDACLRYEVLIARTATRHERGGSLAGRVGEDLLLDMGLWFWRPESLTEDEDIEVEFLLPEGMAVSVPWEPVEGPATEAAGARTFRTGRTPYDWPALIAFGKFRDIPLEVPGTRLNLVIVGVTARIPVDRIRGWIENAALGVTTVHGRFPWPRARIIVLPNAQGNEAIPWAFVQRGGGLSAQFFINHRLPDEELLTEWTLFHELAHMLLPKIVAQDAWLSEGLASYYQNVLRARRGVISTLNAWQRMHAGFARGRKSQVGSTLADATERMYRNAGFMRVYWQGAALLALADYRVRLRTEGRHSLDSALAGIAQCCMTLDGEWRARDLLARMDAITGTRVFTELHDQQIPSPEFPDLRELYDGLGFVVREGELQFTESAPHVTLREAIMQAPAANPQEDTK